MTVQETVPVARATYRYLRLMMITLPVLLLVGSLLAFWFLEIVETSISAYYLGPMRDVFVGVMVATAACMVVYRGSSLLEDYSLNVAGFYAVLVALVPTDLGRTLTALEPDARAELVTSLQVSVVAVLVVAALFVWLEVRTTPGTPNALAANRLRRVLVYSTSVLLLGFLALLVWRLVEAEAFAWVHPVAAVLLVAGLATAVAGHAWPEATASGGSSRAAGTSAGTGARDHRGKYRMIFALMVAGAPLFGLLWLLDWDYRVIVVEWYEIALFALFWALETWRTWPQER